VKTLFRLNLPVAGCLLWRHRCGALACLGLRASSSGLAERVFLAVVELPWQLLLFWYRHWQLARAQQTSWSAGAALHVLEREGRCLLRWRSLSVVRYNPAWGQRRTLRLFLCCCCEAFVSLVLFFFVRYQAGLQEFYICFRYRHILYLSLLPMVEISEKLASGASVTQWSVDINGARLRGLCALLR
jgi:hypothetical protein